MQELKVEYKNHICRAVIQRPESHNAVNFVVMEQLEELLTELEANETIRCFIINGQGEESFISGGDLKEFHTLKTAEEARPMAERMHAILRRIEMLPCWTIACLNGDAYGGGWEIMLAFDFRIAAETVRIGFTQGKFYLPPGWGGLTRLVEQVGRSTALCWLAEAAVIDAEHALTNQLINKLKPSDVLQKACLRWGEQLCHNDRDYIRTLKQGALRASAADREAMSNELKPFAQFWEDERHHRRVWEFLHNE